MRPLILVVVALGHHQAAIPSQNFVGIECASFMGRVWRQAWEPRHPLRIVLALTHEFADEESLVRYRLATYPALPSAHKSAALSRIETARSVIVDAHLGPAPLNLRGWGAAISPRPSGGRSSGSFRGSWGLSSSPTARTPAPRSHTSRAGKQSVCALVTRHPCSRAHLSTLRAETLCLRHSSPDSQLGGTIHSLRAELLPPQTHTEYPSSLIAPALAPISRSGEQHIWL